MAVFNNVDVSAVIEQPKMQPLKSHNHLIGDHQSLTQAWESDGYWFFKDVLDKSAVARLRALYIEELERHGVIDSPRGADTSKSVRYNGTSLKAFPFRMEALAERELWRDFVAEPKVHEFFIRLFGEDPFWVPIAEYRATPPTQDRTAPRFVSIHQDGPYSPGIPFRICWIPLAHIDQEIGGMGVVEGLTEKINRHPQTRGSNKPIPLQDLPADKWRHTSCEAGDLLLMNLWTPHSGMTNLSDHFRLSLDLRVMERSAKCPIVGIVESIDAQQLTIFENEKRYTLQIDENTYARNTVGEKLSLQEMTDFFQPGSPVIAAYEGDRATVIRPPH